MKLLKCTFLLCGLLLLHTTATAHALWIETAGAGKAGQPHQVKIFYGEFEHGTLETVSEWYADVRTFKLWLTDPDGKQQEVEVWAAENHFVASFTPASEGQYRLHVNHLTGEVAGTTVYEFNSSALVMVGNKASVAPEPPIRKDLLLTLPAGQQPRRNKLVTLQVHNQEQAAKEVRVNVMAPAGWQKQIVTSSQGQATFTPEWSGNYLLEAQHKEEAEGEIGGKPYKAIYKIATRHLEVK
ncbi:DUF4198 domain-containing protein [Pontibacter qinzhouensis]|uniref:DUF4198 domain-containing protein n=1 Tax=Pontibacter qinzhouensis TaxID=2603253 RepID=A0A5C8KEV5_9BACT|nr:DUF4198 domain-containing protein [Pontibacter qinzhouensis]TXK51571.1 DUF4198 domain-containing protein [Pontibacter qinzhouensis]